MFCITIVERLCQGMIHLYNYTTIWLKNMFINDLLSLSCRDFINTIIPITIYKLNQYNQD